MDGGVADILVSEAPVSALQLILLFGSSESGPVAAMRGLCLLVGHAAPLTAAQNARMSSAKVFPGQHQHACPALSAAEALTDRRLTHSKMPFPRDPVRCF